MGNRMMSVMGALVYSRISGRTLSVDWSDRAYSNDRSNVFPRLFSAPQVIDPADLYSMVDVCPRVWKGNLEKSVDEIYSILNPHDPDADQDESLTPATSIDFRSISHPERVVVRWAWYHDLRFLRPHFGSLNLGRDVGGVLQKVAREKLVPGDVVVRRVEQFASRHFVAPVIGLHIRQTDRQNRYHAYFPMIKDILHRSPTAMIFLATDNRSVEDEFRRTFARVVCTDKWFPAPGQPLHRSGECPDRFEGGVSALVDLYLLARCNYLIYNGTSSFGVLAALLCRANPERIIDTQTKGIVLAARHAYRFLKQVRQRCRQLLFANT